MPPGWYPDPVTPAQLRWWDGIAWGWYTLPVPGGAYGADGAYGAAGGPGREAPTTLLESEALWAPRAQMALLVGVVAYVGQYLYSALVISDTFSSFRRAFRDLQADPNAQPQISQPGSGVRLASGALQLVVLTVGIVFVVWLFKAAALARRMGLPAQRSQVWVVLGFLVPVVNFWFPYQVVRDLFPPEHPGRGLVKQWWAWWLSMSVGGIAILAAGIFSKTAAVVVAVLLSVVAVMAARAARAVITEVGRVHAGLLGR